MEECKKNLLSCFEKTLESNPTSPRSGDEEKIDMEDLCKKLLELKTKEEESPKEKKRERDSQELCEALKRLRVEKTNPPPS